MSDVMIDLESGAPVGDVSADPPADVGVDPTADPPAGDPPADPPADPPVDQKEHRGAVKELIENRRALAQAQQRVQQFENDPALRMLTPEVRQALAEGRIVVKPPTSSADTERERLTELAHDGGFLTADGKPDLDAAARADKLIQKVAARVAAPALQRVQQLESRSHAQVANANIAAIWGQATKDGIPADAMTIVHQEFEAAMGMPNAAQTLAQPEVAAMLFERALGRAFREGKLAGKGKAEPPKGGNAPIVAEPGGRRSPAAAALQLTPAIAAVYKNAGIDPASAPSSKALKVVRGGVELE